MGHTFSQFAVTKFPDKPKTKGTEVLSLGELHLGGGKSEQTRLVYKADSVHGKYERYQVYHESTVHQQVRTYEGQEFDHFYKKNNFDAFLDREAKVLYCCASKSISRSLVDALNQSSAERFNLDYMGVDFAVLKSKMQNVRGIWVAGMNQPFCNTAAFFGPNVEQSDFYQQAAASGQASSFLFHFTHGGVDIPIILTSSCGITFLRDDPEAMCFDIIRKIQDGLLKDAAKTSLSKYNAKKKRELEAAIRKAEQKPTPKPVIDHPSQSRLFASNEVLTVEKPKEPVNQS